MGRTIQKNVLSSSEMIAYGYKRRLLYEITHDPDCTHLFFRSGTGKTSNIYFYLDKVQRWLEMREDERMGVML